MHVDRFTHILRAILLHCAVNSDLRAGTDFNSIGAGAKIADVSVGFVGDNGVFLDMNNSVIAQADGIFIADAVNGFIIVAAHFYAPVIT